MPTVNFVEPLSVLLIFEVMVPTYIAPYATCFKKNAADASPARADCLEFEV